MRIYESAEDYLERILMLEKRNGTVRARDIVSELGYSKPSVSIAMKSLRENGYITIDTRHQITLTDKGREIAECMLERHWFMTEALKAIGVEETLAAKEACRIEHVISEDTFEKLKAHANRNN